MPIQYFSNCFLFFKVGDVALRQKAQEIIKQELSKESSGGLEKIEQHTVKIEKKVRALGDQTKK